MYPNGNVDTLVNPLVANNTVWMTSGFPSSITLHLGMVNSIAETGADASSAIEVFPNPSDERISVVLPEAGGELFLHDVSGRKVLHQPISESGTVELSVATFKRGVYVLTYFTPNGKALKEKVVIR